MDFHGINTLGKNWLERVATKPVWEASFEGRLIYASDTETISFATAGEWIDIASASSGGITNPAVPIGAIVLFEADVALDGYTLLTDQDDELVYITAGNGTGVGGLGGDPRTGSTWTLDTHIHPFSFSDPGAAHLHKWFTYGGAAAGDYSYDAAGNPSGLARNNNHGPAQAKLVTAADDDLNGTKDFWTTATTTPISGSDDTDPQVAVDTWRPKGRNWTRQQKN